MTIAHLISKHGDNWRLAATGQQRRSADANANTEWRDIHWAVINFTPISMKNRRFWRETTLQLHKEHEHASTEWCDERWAQDNFSTNLYFWKGIAEGLHRERAIEIPDNPNLRA